MEDIQHRNLSKIFQIPDKVHLEMKKLKEQYGDNVQKCARLEEELERCQKRVRFLENVQGAKRDECTVEFATELASVKAQLSHKTQLLDKVKILLQKAATKEKALLEQVCILNRILPEMYYDSNGKSLLDRDYPLVIHKCMYLN